MGWGGALFLAVLVAYQSVWHAGFVWDDDKLITINPCLVGPLGLKEVWTTRAADICPLTITTLWAEHKLWGASPLPYHLFTVCLHGACAVLLWKILEQLKVPGAWLGAALWAVHPVQVESVAWVAEMKNTQSGLFYLLTILFYLLSRRPEHAAAWWPRALVWLCAALAMTSKTSTIVLPAVLCLLGWWLDRRWRWRSLLENGPVFALALAAGAWSLWTQTPADTVRGATVSVGGWPLRLALAGQAAWFYLGKIVWPHPLVNVYPRWRLNAGGPLAWLALLSLVGLAALLWRGRRAAWSRSVALAGAYFLVALSPVLGFVDISYFHLSFVADHFVYLASMGPLALAGAGITRIAGSAHPKRQEWMVATAAATLCLAAGTATWCHARIYENQRALWNDTLVHHPDAWVAWFHLGATAQSEGRLDEAAGDYRRAAQLGPGEVEIHNNLGNVLLRQGKAKEAVDEYQAALKLRPLHTSTHNNLGTALLQLGRVEEAAQEYRAALSIDPDNAGAHNNLGNLLLQTGRRDEAAAEYRRTLALDPGQVSASDSLAALLLQQGRTDEAVAQYRASLRIRPGSAAHRRLGAALVQAKLWPEAVAEFQDAVRLRPDSPEARRDLETAQALARQASAAR